ncbi:TatD family hydrolase [Nitrosarchaeum koreense]|nr:TatD family hydrolase [Nitrosarchaeum koreense]
MFIDPHVHMYSRTTDDYEKMILSGIKTVIEPSFWLGQARTSSKTLIDYWEYLINFERARAREFGINHYCAISVNPKEANNSQLANESLDVMANYLSKEGVVAVGEIGFDMITKEEEKVFARQLVMAEELKMPVIIHTPHINKVEGIKKTFDIIKNCNATKSRIIIDHNTEETIELSLSYDVIAGITVYPYTKVSSIRAVNMLKKYGTDRILINSSADWGVSDPLSVPKTAIQMEKDGFSKNEIEQLLFHNPNNFFKQSKNYVPL